MYLETSDGELQVIDTAARFKLLHFHAFKGSEAPALQLNQVIHAI